MESNIALILAISFSLAFILGFLAQKLKLSPILGYLLAGYIVGPYSPGLVVNLKIAEQLSEVGIILLMFGVGLHFSWKDLTIVRVIALPGAIIQTAVAAILGAMFVVDLGGTWSAGIVVGFAIGVASTAVLVRVLLDNHLLETPQGRIAVGWLIVEDILTIFVLLMLPQMAFFASGQEMSWLSVTFSTLFVIFKLAALGVIIYFFGQSFTRKILLSASRTRSYEIFTLALLAVIFAIATGATFIFGTSIALGAFLAGMVVGNTDVSHQAAAITLPMKDAFTAIFFIAVGMLFDPKILMIEPKLFIGLLFIIMLVKPITAFFIVYLFRYPIKSALVVGLALGQIGEFSFILAEEASRLNLLSDKYYDALVACALISIAVNPLLFKMLHKIVGILSKTFGEANNQKEMMISKNPYAVIIGFGPIGKAVTAIIKKKQMTPIIIDGNIDTVLEAKKQGIQGIFGDASQFAVIESAHLDHAKMLIVTIPETEIVMGIVQFVRQRYPHLYIVARTLYLADHEKIEALNAVSICAEERVLDAFKEVVEKKVGKSTTKKKFFSV